MSSPVSVNFYSIIKIDRRKEDAVYIQIVYQFINAVKRNLLEDGDLLPGSRKIATELKVHRKTVVAALSELQEQGWVEIRPNRGTFVKNPDRVANAASAIVAFRQPPDRAPYHFRRELILDTPVFEIPEKYYFTDGTPDYRIIETEELVRFYAAMVKRKKKSDEFLATADGNLFFRDQLSYYLNLTRGFHLSRNFLLPIASREQIFSILSRLLIQRGDVVLVENLSYFLPNMIFSQAGARLKTVPVDAMGMNIDYIADQFKPGEIRCVYINTKCQYPTTVSLSEERKLRLLQLAEQYHFIVIEDDVDFECSLVKDKSESLFRKNAGQHVIYIGTFGRFLDTGFQMNFLIAPQDLLEEGKKYLNLFGKPNFMIEKTLGEIIHQGDIFRYQRKFQKIVTERKDLFAQLLDSHFGDKVAFTVPVSGLAFWIQFNSSFSLTALQEKAREKGVLLPSNCLYQNRAVTALRLGFAHLDEKDMSDAIHLLHSAYQELFGTM
ncbi:MULTISPECIES: PLP-dependent aminotransferase family protein [unclassified Sphingobacterium]|uniref:aminotransferase-like domain-containing protein n=1 Tax=unclassified Sphingobacterium TaxID=2609468 RepID=UPI0025E3DC07|nr:MULTISPECIES: PLP-dependent aminotransferase family protein [unclassified Sphingobacterium]